MIEQLSQLAALRRGAGMHAVQIVEDRADHEAQRSHVQDDQRLDSLERGGDPEQEHGRPHHQVVDYRNGVRSQRPRQARDERPTEPLLEDPVKAWLRGVLGPEMTLILHRGVPQTYYLLQATPLPSKRIGEISGALGLGRSSRYERSVQSKLGNALTFPFQPASGRLAFAMAN